MPSTISYDAATQRLHVGDGFIDNVTQEMWDYRVSGTHVVREWFNDRRRDRTPTVIGNRTVSELWKIHSDSWQASYTSELLDLLNVLGLLIELEADQAVLLAAVTKQPVWSVAELTDERVLPVEAAERQVVTDVEGTLF